MTRAGNSNIQYLAPLGVPQPGSPVQTGAGGYAGGVGGVQALQFRSPVDAARSMMGQRIPSAEYPDGYLGTIRSRRDDRILDTVKSRLNERGYQRGVHKGERIDPSDYFWPPGFDPMSRIEMQAKAVQPSMDDRRFFVPRAAPAGTFRDRITTMGEKVPREILEAAVGDPRVVQGMDRLRPPWS